MAKCTPLSVRPSADRSRGTVAPGAQHDRVEVLRSSSRLDVLADVGVADELDAFLLHELMRRRTTDALVELHVRDAVHQQAARAVGALEHGDRVARPVELRGGREPGGPRADHRDLLAGAHGGGSGMTQPSSQPRSMIVFSMFLIVTGGALMPSTHEPSQGAGRRGR
jgi:hypothetical protein